MDTSSLFRGRILSIQLDHFPGGRPDHLARGQDPDYAVYGFSPDTMPSAPQGHSVLEAHPAHLQVRTLRLSLERYLEVVREIYTRLSELAVEDDEHATLCTFAVLAFDGGMDNPTTTQNVQMISSFVPLHSASQK